MMACFCLDIHIDNVFYFGDIRYTASVVVVVVVVTLPFLCIFW